MENKRNSKKTVKLLVVLIALLLIACSILGFTLARYVTQGDPGTAGVGIANWKITATEAGTEAGGSGETGIPLTLFSPNMQGYDSSKDRSRSKDNVLILQIKNEGDVSAYVKLETGEVNAYGPNSETPIDFNSQDNRDPGEADYYKPWKESWNNIFTFTTTVRIGTNAENTMVAQTQPSGDYSGYYALDVGQSLFVYANITWTTDLTDDTQVTSDGYTAEDNVWEGDLRDTWIGENVEKVALSYSWYAVQGSQLPDGGVSEPTP